jgi:hypothetical protein
MEQEHPDYRQIEEELKPFSKTILQFAEKYRNDPLTLVTILGQIESLHRHIRIEMLENCLPDTRHNLYLLLKHIEEIGGWPYIERMKLQKLCEQFLLNKDHK